MGFWCFRVITMSSAGYCPHQTRSSQQHRISKHCQIHRSKSWPILPSSIAHVLVWTWYLWIYQQRKSADFCMTDDRFLSADFICGQNQPTLASLASPLRCYSLGCLLYMLIHSSSCQVHSPGGGTVCCLGAVYLSTFHSVLSLLTVVVCWELPIIPFCFNVRSKQVLQSTFQLCFVILWRAITHDALLFHCPIRRVPHSACVGVGGNGSFLECVVVTFH